MNSIEYTLNYFGIQVEDRASLRPWLGPPLVESLMKYYGFDRRRALEGVKKYREYFDVKGIFENQVYDGMEDLLTGLQEKGYILMTATSKPEAAAKQNGLESIGVLYGYGDRDELETAGADYIAETVEAIARFL